MKRLLLVALMVLVSLVGMVGVSRAGDEVSALQASANTTNVAVSALHATVNAGVPDKAKMYYLTVTGFTGSDAITACDAGFHMANLPEIIDTSNLQYATGLPSAFSDIVSFDDQRDGPSTIEFGWVRTGYASTPDPTRDPYESLNCNNESISTDDEWGTVARIYNNVTASQMDSEWVGVCARECSQHYRVWCVENI